MKILVTTDLSPNSASAIYFAYKLSQLKGASLVIVFVYHLSKPKSWRQDRFEKYSKARSDFFLNKLNRFVDRIFDTFKEPTIHVELDLQMNHNTEKTILQCGAKHKCAYICISTLGAGKSKNTIGTTASKLIKNAPIPILSIPSSYKIKSMDRICYASDMSNYLQEIEKIIKFVIPYRSEIRILHIVSKSEILIKKTLLEARLLKRTGVPIKVKYTLRDLNNYLIEDITHSINKIRPSLVVFYISRSKPNFNSILYSTDAYPLTIFKKNPLLIYKK